MEMLADIVPVGLLGVAIAVALWAWHEIRDVVAADPDSTMKARPTR